MKAIVATLAAIFISSSASAVSYTGNDLYLGLRDFKALTEPGGASKASTESAVRAFSAEGYLRGVIDSVGNEGYFCLPERWVMGQVIDVVHNYLKDNPRSRHDSAAIITGAVLSVTFPCKDSKLKK